MDRRAVRAGGHSSAFADTSLVAVACLYSAAQTVSASFQNALTAKQECLPSVPFGECVFGEHEAQSEVWPRRDRVPQYVIGFAVALLAGRCFHSYMCTCGRDVDVVRRASCRRVPTLILSSSGPTRRG